jgi:hypothetical protein
MSPWSCDLHTAEPQFFDALGVIETNLERTVLMPAVVQDICGGENDD